MVVEVDDQRVPGGFQGAESGERLQRRVAGDLELGDTFQPAQALEARNGRARPYSPPGQILDALQAVEVGEPWHSGDAEIVERLEGAQVCERRVTSTGAPDVGNGKRNDRFGAG